MKLAFEGLHPVVGAVYLVGMFVITMISMNPYLVVMSLLFSFFYNCLIAKKILWKRFFLTAGPILLFAVGIMPLFSHNGVTPIFYVNDMAVTLETIRYGLVMSGLLVAMLQWFQVWNVWIDSEKFIYLFGRISPTLALLLSMVFRFIPMFLRRFREIQDVQRGMGYSKEGMTIGDRLRLLEREISILVSWSLEHSMETSMSMEGRGYGIGRRTSFHLFTWKKEDIVTLFIEAVLIAGVIIGILSGSLQVYYFPAFWMKDWNLQGVCSLGCLSLFLLLPLIMEGKKIVVLHGDFVNDDAHA